MAQCVAPCALTWQRSATYTGMVTACMHSYTIAPAYTKLASLAARTVYWTLVVCVCVSFIEHFMRLLCSRDSCKLYDQNHVGGKLDELGKSSLLVKENVMIAYYNYNTSLDVASTIFLAYYRKTFPGASMTVKLHMLEDHMVPSLLPTMGSASGRWVSRGPSRVDSCGHELHQVPIC